MKKLFLLFVLVSLSSCGIAMNLDRTAKNMNWFPIDMKPSQVKDSGEVFYTADLKNGESLSIYFDDDVYNDSNYYRNQLWESYGWTVGIDSQATASAYASAPSNSTLYISIKRGVAIYIYPEGTWQIFKAHKH